MVMKYRIDKDRMETFINLIMTKKELTEKERLIAYNSIETRIMLAKSGIKEVLEMLADDWCIDVRDGVAGNPNTPVSVLEKLARDNDYWVRRRVSINPNTPASVLERLAEDDDVRVRILVALNPNTPVVVLERLAEDEEWVRKAVYENPNTPNEIRKTIKRRDYFILGEREDPFRNNHSHCNRTHPKI
jgi:hypothetical protein